MPTDPVAGAPIVTDDGSTTLASPRYRQSYHSTRGAVTEAQHVFLHGSGVASALARGEPVHVLEVGFGTGLNCLVSADLAATCSGELHYVGLERELPSAAQLAALDHGRHLHHPALAARLLALRRDIGAEATHWNGPLGSVDLELRLGDAQYQPLERERFHAVYHDGFSPDTNPELWTSAFLEQLGRALVPGGILATYTVQGALRRRLSALGFVVEKRPGPPGGKREVLCARKG